MDAARPGQLMHEGAEAEASAPSYVLHRGAWLDVAARLSDESVSAVVVDPPYHLTASKGASKGFMGKAWDGGDMAFRVETWEEAFRVLKPGGHVLAFSATRTYHRMACAIEDAGFEIRDQLAWVFGQGYPKSQDVSKAIDKAAGAVREVLGTAADFARDGAKRKSDGTHVKPHDSQGGHGYGDRWSEPVTAAATEVAREWAGWGSALKPAWEPICVGRKPLIGTLVENVLAYGTGALNVDACRIEHVTVDGGNLALNPHLRAHINGGNGGHVITTESERRVVTPHALGRWPANLCHDGSAEVIAAFPEASGAVAPVSGDEPSATTGEVFGAYANRAASHRVDGGGSAARFFYCAKASRTDRNEGLEEGGPPAVATGATMREREDADWSSRNANFHPTVKPTALLRWLVRLVTPTGGVVLDFCTGSGSTGKACMLEGFDFIGIDLDCDEDGEPLGYLDIAERRIAHALREWRIGIGLPPEAPGATRVRPLGRRPKTNVAAQAQMNLLF